MQRTRAHRTKCIYLVANLRHLPGRSFMIATTGTCEVCGHDGPFPHSTGSIRESFACQHCHATLRYRRQAQALLEWFSLSAPLARSLGGLLGLHVYEPGIGGPFRPLLKQLPHYEQSYFWPGVQSGGSHKGVRCENLEALTFPDHAFDAVISSDIFEHVLRPWNAFTEVGRVLKPEGIHCFTVPMIWPFPSCSAVRITEDGTPLMPLQHHRSPVEGEPCPVVTDWGSDLIDRLNASGWCCQVECLSYNVTIIARKV